MSTRAPGRIALRNVTKSYGEQLVLERASVTIESGEFVAVLGRSGSGKSTLLRLIGGLERPDAGEIIVGGEALGALSETRLARLRRHALGFVFQFFNLIPTLTVGENVELPLALNGTPKAEARRRSLAALEELDVGRCAPRFPEELSGGEQQRVAIARAVVHEPPLVLADEPTGNLDLETAEHVLTLLAASCARRGATLVMATHSPEALGRAGRRLSIRHGAIAEDAP